MKNFPSEVIINDETKTDSKYIATKLNVYFSSIAEIINEHTDEVSTFKDDKLSNFVNN